MPKAPKRNPRPSGAKGKLTSQPGFRSPIRVSIDHEALAALDKRAVAAQVALAPLQAGWQAYSSEVLVCSGTSLPVLSDRSSEALS